MDRSRVSGCVFRAVRVARFGPCPVSIKDLPVCRASPLSVPPQSEQAQAVRRSIRNKECACPLANQAYSNILCHYPSLARAIFTTIGVR